jgi:hypothetical protein
MKLALLPPPNMETTVEAAASVAAEENAALSQETTQARRPGNPSSRLFILSAEPAQDAGAIASAKSNTGTGFFAVEQDTLAGQVVDGVVGKYHDAMGSSNEGRRQPVFSHYRPERRGWR